MDALTIARISFLLVAIGTCCTWGVTAVLAIRSIRERDLSLLTGRELVVFLIGGILIIAGRAL